MSIMVVPQGAFDLRRPDTAANSSLRAWDGADEYALSEVAELDVTTGNHTVVVNDGYGALTVALGAVRGSSLWSWSDSYLAHAAARANQYRAAEGDADRLVADAAQLPDRIDLLIVKVPKDLATLEYQLAVLAARVHPDTVVIGAGMTKHIHNSTIEIFERLIGPTTTSRARKKARLIRSVVDRDRSAAGSAMLSREVSGVSFHLSSGQLIVGGPGVFGSEQLDRGTRVLLDHLRLDRGVHSIVDLACGTGVLGMMAGQLCPDAEVTFVDESYSALLAARSTWAVNNGPDRTATFLWADGLRASAGSGAEFPALPLPGSIDVVVCNPPFHVGNHMGDDMAIQMFRDAVRVLRSGGELWVVGHRHLGYHARLAKRFATCEVVSGDPKFVVCRAVAI